MKPQPLSHVKLNPLNTQRLTFLADIPQGTPLETVTSPEYWANISNKVVLRSHIEADWEDGSRLVVLRVVGVGLNYVKVKVLQDHEFNSDSKESKNDFTVKFMGRSKWSVLKGKDYLKSGFDSEPDANEWLTKYLSGELEKAA